jgi:hypothetical protein
MAMSGFAVSGRVERASPHLAVTHDRGRGPTSSRRSEEVSELVDVRAADPLGDRWAAFRDRWSALTFYLFDPQSWRR